VDFSIEQSQYPLRVSRLFLHPKSLSKLWILSKEKASPSCGLALFFLDHQVESAGIEPASKQGSLRLSTCLACG